MKILVCGSSIYSPKRTGLGRQRNASVQPQTVGASIFVEVRLLLSVLWQYNYEQ